MTSFHLPLRIHLDDDTLRRLTEASTRTGRSLIDLAETAISEAALEWAKVHSPEFNRNRIPQKGLSL